MHEYIVGGLIGFAVGVVASSVSMYFFIKRMMKNKIASLFNTGNPT